ncbi:hypothetical protein IX39_16530 [Chryseobacterium formosense]|uniref:Uncharacterized protein n=1 Tax=Chryseobacterium formosense TaxID=236814 RepID=A0A085Z0P7_9FLAO|nr:hypothetical protein [Chryseobacterium formosense]KFE98010.1 hypothetical protein IX39_16530 [Chryseobacterium formosense]SFT72098.1 hypothetical protein SAMN05421857_2714 [Chryseobacterium formosense]
MKIKNKNINVQELINEGNNYSSENNCKIKYGEYFSDATPEFLAWISKVENFIYTNFDENSGPYKMLQTADKSKFSGYYLSEFDRELQKYKGAIKSCEHLKPNKSKSENVIISLIKNPVFWTTLVVVIGGSYKLGFDNGNSKFDKEKQEFIDINKKLIDSVKLLKIENSKLNKENFILTKKGFQN